MRFKILSIFLFFSVLSVAAESPRLTLKEFLQKSVSEGPGLLESKAKIEHSQAREKLAASLGLPTLKADYIMGVAPEATGNAVVGQTNYDNWGLAQGVGLEFVQPVFTFGAISRAKKASRVATEAEIALQNKEELSLRTQVAEIYYGYQLAFEFAELASSVVGKLKEARDKGKKISKTKAADLDKLEVYILDTQARVLEAEKALNLMRSAMGWKLGCQSVDCQPKWDSASLMQRDWTLKMDNSNGKLRESSIQNRPELFAAQKNLEARKALLGAEESQYLPLMYIGGQLQKSWSAGRDDQESPFAYDPLNELKGVAGLGVRWNLGFFEKSAKVAMARAEVLKAEALLRNASEGLRADFDRVLGDAQFYKTSLELRTQAAKISKRVFYDSVFSFTLGTGTAKDILEALGAFGLAEKSRLETLYNYNVHEFKIAQVLGVKLEN
jgi:outer membrane protein TolC